MDKKLPGPIDLLVQAWDVFRSRFWTLVVIQLVPLLIVIPLLFVVGGIYYLTGNYERLSEEMLTTLLSTARVVVLAMIPVVLVGVVLQLWSQVALMVAVKDRVERVGFVQAYRRGWAVLRSYLWVSLLAGLAIIGATLLLIIPGIIVGIWFSFAAFVVVVEGLRGRAALGQSRELVRGHWWGVFGRYLFLTLVFLGVLLVSSLLEQLWAQIGARWVGNVVSTIVSFLWAPFGIIYSYLMYESLKTLKEPSTDTQAP